MKKYLTTLFGILLLAGQANAQTYANITLTNFTLNGGVYVATTNITVGANVLVTLNTVHMTPNIVGEDAYGNGWPYLGVKMGVKYGSSPWVSPNDDDFNVTTYNNHPVLGPCTLRFTATATNNSSPAVNLLLQYSTVNVSPSAVGAVQPPNKSVAVNLQSSTNFTTWTTATNGNYGSSDQYRFFRVSLQ